MVHPLPVLADFNVRAGSAPQSRCRRRLWSAEVKIGISLLLPVVVEVGAVLWRHRFTRVPWPRLGLTVDERRIVLVGLHRARRRIVHASRLLAAQFRFLKLDELGNKANIGRDSRSSFGDIRVRRLERPRIGMYQVCQHDSNGARLARLAMHVCGGRVQTRVV